MLAKEKKTSRLFFLKQFKKKNILNFKEFTNELGYKLKIEHDNILKIHFVSEDKKNISIFYEKFEGKILKNYPVYKKGIPENKVFIIILQIAKIIEIFHKSDIQLKNLNVNH